LTLSATVAAALATLATRHAHAQDIDVPTLVQEGYELEESKADQNLDLSNLVQSAAKGVTTVQEAPAIITILTAEELKERNTRNVEDALDTIPGWLRNGAVHSLFPYSLTRGFIQGMLMLQNGISLFDPVLNVPSVGRTVPLETFKRIEVMTGPGGVLWGANSFLGVVNLISLEADDVNGLEAGVGAGDGPGDRRAFRTYVMAGQPRLFGTRVGLFAHASFETYQGARWEMPSHLYSSPLPQPNSTVLYGPTEFSDQRRSYIVNLDGNLKGESWSLYWSYPFVRRYYGLTFPGSVVNEELPEDDVCPQTDRNDPVNHEAGDECIDQGRVWRDNSVLFYERYGIAEYKTRFAENRAGFTGKVYAIDFERSMQPINILPPIAKLLEGGLSFSLDLSTYRVGTVLDGDWSLPGNFRLLYGAEAFHEWLPDRTSQSRQGPGTETRFWGPYDPGRLPLPCPRDKDGAYIEDCPLTIAFATDRTVVGAYVNANFRPVKSLILDGGVRIQAAPEELGKRSYPWLPIFSAAAVYEFIPDWHLKLNYAEGFRPPVFNNTDSNGQAVALEGQPNLETERSKSIQTEVNARVLKGRRHIRELDLRADYSYTRIDNFIGLATGIYENTAPRGIHSGEFLAKLYLKGNHRLEIGYTYLKTNMEDIGVFRSMPEHWFNVGGVVQIIKGRLLANLNVKVIGAFEDPNRRVDASDLSYDNTVNGHLDIANGEQVRTVLPTELVMDRVPAAGELQLGVRYLLPEARMTIAATAYNALNSRHYQPDYFNSYQPRLEFLPNPYEDYRVFVQATYQP
jgi:outer membrane receptor protein involved in Fe transport